ncbi:MAG: hypothetical protein JW871_05220 [Endomicrobiales bacterium]|nr:hypothetical protein [Endomicrobiales bacterium]
MFKDIFASLFLITFLASNCFSADKNISIVLSSQKGIYNEVLSGLEGFLKGNGISASYSQQIYSDDRKKDILDDIEKNNPDVIIAFGHVAINFVNKNINNIPVIYTMTFLQDIVEKNPNSTGVVLDMPAELRIKIIKKVFPSVKNIGSLYSTSSSKEYANILKSCKALNLGFIAKEIISSNEISGAYAEIEPKIDCFMIVFDTKLYNVQTTKYLLLATLKNNIPLVGLSSFYTRAGAVMAYDYDYSDIGIQTGMKVLDILKGKSPSVLELSMPRKLLYFLNTDSAKKMNIEFSADVLKEASEVLRN